MVKYDLKMILLSPRIRCFVNVIILIFSRTSVGESVGPRSLPVTPRLSVEPNTPSPLVVGDRSRSRGGQGQGSTGGSGHSPASQSIVKSSSATGLSLMIPTEECHQVMATKIIMLL